MGPRGVIFTGNPAVTAEGNGDPQPERDAPAWPGSGCISLCKGAFGGLGVSAVRPVARLAPSPLSHYYRAWNELIPPPLVFSHPFASMAVTGACPAREAVPLAPEWRSRRERTSSVGIGRDWDD